MCIWWVTSKLNSAQKAAEVFEKCCEINKGKELIQINFQFGYKKETVPYLMSRAFGQYNKRWNADYGLRTGYKTRTQV